MFTDLDLVHLFLKLLEISVVEFLGNWINLVFRGGFVCLIIGWLGFCFGWKAWETRMEVEFVQWHKFSGKLAINAWTSFAGLFLFCCTVTIKSGHLKDVNGLIAVTDGQESKAW